MDKRKFLWLRELRLSDGRIFTVKVYQKSNNRGMSCRMVYGEIEAYISNHTTMYDLDKFLCRCIQKHPEKIIDRPYMKDGIYCYVLGKKRYFATRGKSGIDEMFFYLASNVKDYTVVYKRLFLSYLKERVPMLAKRMGLDVSDWSIQTGLFLSYYGVCFPTKHVLKFDYRLFAYKSEISDAILFHELTHILDIHHDERFYRIVKLYCPDYDYLESEIECGYFEGGMN